MTADRISIVLPAYDEERSIDTTIVTVARYLDLVSCGWEILVVDDGSDDATVAVARARAATDSRVRVLEGRRNFGKGHAVKRGMLDATGDIVCFMDVDLSTPVEELGHALPLVAAGADVVVGTRADARSRVLVPQPRWRAAMGDVFRRISIGILRLPVTDVTCGFKVFTRRAAREVFTRVRLDDWSFDAEALYVAKRLGLRIAELPITWRDDPRTRVRPERDAALAAVGVGRVLLRAWRGEYDVGGR